MKVWEVFNESFGLLVIAANSEEEATKIAEERMGEEWVYQNNPEDYEDSEFEVTENVNLIYKQDSPTILFKDIF